MGEWNFWNSSCSSDRSPAEATAPEGCWRDGHGEEQRGCRSVGFHLFFHNISVESRQLTFFDFTQIATWRMSWWFPVRVVGWEWETLMPRVVWWWSTCSARWRRRSESSGDIFSCSVAFLPSVTLPLLSTQAVNEVSPQLFTIATLTGHAIRAMGPNYSVSTAETQTISSRAVFLFKSMFNSWNEPFM